MSRALPESGMGLSSTSADEEASAVEIEEQKSRTAGAGMCTDSEKSTRLASPWMCGMKLVSGRLKFTGQAEWTIRETDWRICSMVDLSKPISGSWRAPLSATIFLVR